MKAGTSAKRESPDVQTIFETIIKESGNGDLVDGIRETDQSLQMLEIARRFVPFILASGVFQDGERSWRDAVHPLATAAGDLAHPEALGREFIDRYGPSMSTYDPEAALMGVAYAFARAHARAAYLLGLAVGQALGPAFKTGGPR